jgi:rapamycin-insensitive companion of mTOR
MLTKDHNKWTFETLLDLIEGPLLNPKRMEEAIKLSRFLRRLMNFFHPFNHRFCDLERNKVSPQRTRGYYLQLIISR